MGTRFDELVNGMINVGFGVAATAAEKGKEVLDELGAKGQEVRGDAATPDFARSMSDVFERAGGVFSDATERLGAHGDSVAVRVLDELILARARSLDAPGRAAFVSHVADLVRVVDGEAVSIPVESVEDVDPDAEQGE
ncbi:MAG: hypothetical protein SOU51_02055 [Collinsella sp.]|nr:hypothetical protein [Collinsella sp.]